MVLSCLFCSQSAAREIIFEVSGFILKFANVRSERALRCASAILI